MQRPHRLDHGQDASGEHAVRAADGTVVHLDVERAEAGVGAVCAARRRDRVGDEGDPLARRAPDHRGGLGCEVDAVEDDADDDVVTGERRADDAGIAVAERPHRVEEVGDAVHAAVERRIRLLGGRVAVAERDGDPAREQAVDHLAGAGKLGGKRHQPHRPRVEQAVEQRHVGVTAGFRNMRAEAARREKRPFEVHAEDARPLALARNFAHRCDHLLLGTRDQGRQIRGDAGLEQCHAGAPVSLGVGVEEVDAPEPVHLQIDEARHGDSAAVRRRQAGRGQASVVDLDVARNEHAFDQTGLDSEPHGSLRLPRIWTV